MTPLAPPEPDCRCDRPDLRIFGAAKGGTPLMQAAQTMGINVQLKALVWQETRRGKLLSTTTIPQYLTRRHGLRRRGQVRRGCPMTAALEAIAAKATAAP